MSTKLVQREKKQTGRKQEGGRKEKSQKEKQKMTMREKKKNCSKVIIFLTRKTLHNDNENISKKVKLNIINVKLKQV